MVLSIVGGVVGAGNSYYTHQKINDLEDEVERLNKLADSNKDDMEFTLEKINTK